MRALYRVLIVGLMLAIYGEWEYSSPLRWNPLDNKPFPKATEHATFEFWSDSGAFRIDVRLPMTKGEESATQDLPMNTQVPCSMLFELYEDNSLVITSKVSRLEQYGATFFNHMDCFSGGTIAIPRFGHYMLKVQNFENESRIMSGKLSLIRRENTENAGFLSGVLYLLIWLLAGTILILWFSNGIKHWRYRRLNLK